MWLTRSAKPFIFTNEYDQQLPYQDCENLGLYVHIPFCNSICSFCPYCKTLYDKEKCNQYIEALIKEISIVGKQLKEKKEVTSLYFGGGTPALAADRIGEIIDEVNKYFIITEGIGVELHPDNVNIPTLKRLRAAGVTKISIGIQSFQGKFQRLLSRAPISTTELQKALDEVEIETVSMDFIFALPGQTFYDLKKDIDMALWIGTNHIAIYPFIDFTFTNSNIKQMPKAKKRMLLDKLTEYCQSRGLKRDSIWTFSANSNARYSSMTRVNFLGFGCSAATLLKEQFKINTFSVDEYCKRINHNRLPTSLTIRFTLRQRMVYYLFWSAYSTKIKSSSFEEFFGVPLKKMYGKEFSLAKRLGFITEKNGVYSMTKKGVFYYHYYESFYTLAYIDKMWGIMRNKAFPKEIRL
ncbi:coproporphyrinogen-III oxidase family protein [Ruminococcus sp.]|uniref:coproporphyrinogen-III oxidase family protein n=1 Tax=Ruminococcus sp. TaxID=41978 RepID=UPI0038908024